jgi:hypothetical protein
MKRQTIAVVRSLEAMFIVSVSGPVVKIRLPLQPKHLRTSQGDVGGGE